MMTEWKESKPHFTGTLVVMSREIYICRTSMSSHHLSWRGSMPARFAERKGRRHGQSIAFMRHHYQSAGEMQFRKRVLVL